MHCHAYNFSSLSPSLQKIIFKLCVYLWFCAFVGAASVQKRAPGLQDLRDMGAETKLQFMGSKISS